MGQVCSERRTYLRGRYRNRHSAFIACPSPHTFVTADRPFRGLLCPRLSPVGGRGWPLGSSSFLTTEAGGVRGRVKRQTKVDEGPIGFVVGGRDLSSCAATVVGGTCQARGRT